MKRIAIFLISTYQIVLSPLLRQLVGVRSACRFNPTCSEYTKTKIQEYGMIKGIILGLRQLRECHPFGKTYGRYF